MFMSHTDVVPVEDEAKWQFPPFSATVADGDAYIRTGRHRLQGPAHLRSLMAIRHPPKRNGIRVGGRP